MFKPDSDDPLKNRRLLAMLCAFNGFFIFPITIALFSYKMHVSDDLCTKLIAYMATTCLTPVIAYLYASHKQDSKDSTDASPPA